MTATEGNQSDHADAGISFAAERLTFSESFGFPRIAGTEDRERFSVRPDDRCLDVGCGTGGLMWFLLPDLDNEEGLIGVDRDSVLLAQANEMMDGGKVDVQFQQADALYLPFEDDAYDVVASWFLLCILPELRLALEEMVRVCRPGGTVSSVICFCKSGTSPGSMASLTGMARTAMPRARSVSTRSIGRESATLGWGSPTGRIWPSGALTMRQGWLSSTARAICRLWPRPMPTGAMPRWRSTSVAKNA